MTNEVSLFDGPKTAIPAHIAKFMQESNNLGKSIVTVPSLSYEGKQWTVSMSGQRTTLTTTNADGDEVPVSVLRVVILDFNTRRGRQYYRGEYDPAQKGGPVCWSDDGIEPHSSVQERQASKCDECPMAVRGSKINAQGKMATACSQHRMLAVVPANRLDSPPLRMKLAVTSDYDKQSGEDGQDWLAFQQFRDKLKSKGLGHTAGFVTKMKFDASVPFPKVLFSTDRWLSDDELSTVIPITKSEEVKKLLAGTWTPAGVDGKRIDAVAIDATPQPAPVIPPAKLEVKKAAAKKPELKVVEEVIAPAPQVSGDIDDLLAEWE